MHNANKLTMTKLTNNNDTYVINDIILTDFEFFHFSSDSEGCVPAAGDSHGLTDPSIDACQAAVVNVVLEIKIILN